MNPEHLDDSALYEDESSDEALEPTQSGGAQSKSSKESGRIEEQEEEEYSDDEQEPEPSFPVHLSISIDKVCPPAATFRLYSD